MWNPPSGALSRLNRLHIQLVLRAQCAGTTLQHHSAISPMVLLYFQTFKKSLLHVSLSLISFFALAYFYTGVGGHHLLQSSIPEWLKTLAVASSGLMLISSRILRSEHWHDTPQGAWHNIFSNVPLRFIVFGFINYIFVSIQGTFQAFRDMNPYLHYSQWTVITRAPRALRVVRNHSHRHNVLDSAKNHTGKKLWSKKLMDVTWWSNIHGFHSLHGRYAPLWTRR